jgi:uncharacterized pyridoxamine 5'-phosphate oxidase family protein
MIPNQYPSITAGDEPNPRGRMVGNGLAKLAKMMIVVENDKDIYQIHVDQRLFSSLSLSTAINKVPKNPQYR